MRLYEFSYISTTIKPYLVSKGYKFLGHGVDQMAFLAPDGRSVLKIFGAHDNPTLATSNTASHKMFWFWADYCKKNANNSWLPKFTDWAEFDWEGRRYLQIKMELLAPVSDPNIKLALNKFSSFVNYGKTFVDYTNSTGSREKWMKKPPMPGASEEKDEGVTLLMMEFGERKLKNLWWTAKELKAIADRYAWDFDLHANNYMRRANGQLVIVDPWNIDDSSWI